MQPGVAIAGSVNGRVYHATVPASRPEADYTVRIVPAFPGVRVPAEFGLILWQK